ncbi:MAG: S8 family serine peptidase [Verrucomicrobia bacterium]|nr:S8 family serine peptidase [Verrucomicrobiota bacterium]
MLLPSSLRRLKFAGRALRAAAAALLLSLPVAAPRLHAQTNDDAVAPPNLGHGLRQLARWRATETATLPPAQRDEAVRNHLLATHRRAQVDAAGRVVVNVYLNGTVPATEVSRQMTALGAQVFAHHPDRAGTGAPHGVLSAYLPSGQAAEAARAAGVQSVALAQRPWRRVGAATSQGVGVIRSDVVNGRGFTGRGITVGVISDSFDLTSPHASADVAADDLPGAGNPAGRTTPVFVLTEGDPNDSTNVDEGRGMLQIVHDVAPDAALAFATAGPTQAVFADAITRLRTDPNAHCDVIVDDIGFPDEPFFSDSIVARAADDTVTRTDLPGRQVIFYSAAGNDAGLGYEADFSPLDDNGVRNGIGIARNNLRLNQVPDELTAGGFHNFAAYGFQPTIVQNVTVSGNDAFVDFQWNDPFDASRMTSDFNILVFDANGNYLPDLSGTDNSFATGQALNFANLPLSQNGKDTVYQIVLTRRAGGSGDAEHFRYIVETDGSVTGTYLQTNVPTLFGHTGARNVDAVAAYAYYDLTAPESFTSIGPVTIYFDAAGNRLGTPEVRAQPTIAAPDGVDTSFFPAGALSDTDTDNDGFPNFFGTSAAAPHAAGVAALLLQAGGGSGSLSAARVRGLLQTSAPTHDLDPAFSEATLGDRDGNILVTASGDDSNQSAFSNAFFTISYNGNAGTVLKTLTIDLNPAGLKFDPSLSTGQPFTVGSVTGGASPGVSAQLKGIVTGRGRSAVTIPTQLLLTFSNFPSGGTLSFGIDRDLKSTSSGGNSADALAGATVSATTSSTQRGARPNAANGGVFRNNIGTGYTPVDGFGLINAEAALNLLLGGG